MNNSVYGKTMENLRKRVDVRLVMDEKKLLKLTSKPTSVSCKIFNENLVAIHKIKETLTLNRPAYVGMCILDLRKTLMYDFHYNYIKQKYNHKAKLLFTDTDSLTYEIETNDFLMSKINLISVIILKIVNSMIKLIRKLLENSKMKLLEFQSLNS